MEALALPNKTVAKSERLPPLKNYQLDAIARLVSLEGSSPEMIAATIGCAVERITFLMSGTSRNKTYQKYLDKYRKIVAEHHAGAVMGLIEMIPKAHEATVNALEAEDKRLAAETAFKVYDAVGVTSKGRSGGEDPGAVNIGNININPQAATVLTDSVSNVGSMLTELRAHLAAEVGNGRAHELIGEAALPTPPGQLEVLDGEALTPIDEAQDVFATTEIEDPQ